MRKYPWPPESTASEISRWMVHNGMEICAVWGLFQYGVLPPFLIGLVLISALPIHQYPAVWFYEALLAGSLLISRKWLLETAYTIRQWWLR